MPGRKGPLAACHPQISGYVQMMEFETSAVLCIQRLTVHYCVRTMASRLLGNAAKMNSSPSLHLDASNRLTMARKLCKKIGILSTLKTLQETGFFDGGMTTCLYAAGQPSKYEADGLSTVRICFMFLSGGRTEKEMQKEATRLSLPASGWV